MSEPARPPCFYADPEIFFPRGGSLWAGDVAEAQAICERCPTERRDTCLQDALAAEQGASIDYRHGIYGGTTPEQRAALDPTTGTRTSYHHKRVAA